jgi:hypothetical protein
MPKLPVVKSRQSRVSGQPSQVAGALIPDNTQHFWRDDVRNRNQYVTTVTAGAYMSMKTDPIEHTWSAWSRRDGELNNSDIAT